ncbi:hypothetical protein LDENG_00183290 [Lucifuga dentata]|nr:hypothetical protein LDENG_00183290 [Lucifuga dentata]
MSRNAACSAGIMFRRCRTCLQGKNESEKIHPSHIYVYYFSYTVFSNHIYLSFYKTNICLIFYCIFCCQLNDHTGHFACLSLIYSIFIHVTLLTIISQRIKPFEPNILNFHTCYITDNHFPKHTTGMVN